MSSIALADIASSSDVLSRTHLKPWWETIRSYAWAVMFAVSLYFMYFIDPRKSFNCIPCLEVGVPENLTQCMNTSMGLTVHQMKFANDVCFYESFESDWMYRLVGPLSLLFTAALYMAYSFWLLIPRVVNGFTAVREADKKLSELKLLPSHIEMIATTAQTDMANPHTEKASQVAVVRNCCRKLWIRSGVKGFGITTIYFVRNILCLSLLAAIACICGSILAKDADPLFPCSSPHLIGSQVESFVCFYTIGSTLRPYVILFMVSVSLQILIIVCINIFMAVKFRTSRQFHSVTNDNNIIRVFAEHSEDFTVITRSLISSEPKKIMKLIGATLQNNPHTDDNNLELMGWMLLLQEISSIRGRRMRNMRMEIISEHVTTHEPQADEGSTNMLTDTGFENTRIRRDQFFSSIEREVHIKTPKKWNTHKHDALNTIKGYIELLSRYDGLSTEGVRVYSANANELCQSPCI